MFIIKQFVPVSIYLNFHLQDKNCCITVLNNNFTSRRSDNHLCINREAGSFLKEMLKKSIDQGFKNEKLSILLSKLITDTMTRYCSIFITNINLSHDPLYTVNSEINVMFLAHLALKARIFGMEHLWKVLYKVSSFRPDL